jgi:hypothetical protein
MRGARITVIFLLELNGCTGVKQVGGGQMSLLLNVCTKGVADVKVHHNKPRQLLMKHRKGLPEI